jgi:hypothetical protein
MIPFMCEIKIKILLIYFLRVRIYLFLHKNQEPRNIGFDTYGLLHLSYVLHTINVDQLFFLFYLLRFHTILNYFKLFMSMAI